MPGRDIPTLATWITLAILAGIVFVLSILFIHLAEAQPFVAPPYTTISPSTNPPEIQAWFRSLTNRMGGSCCGESDGYPARITKMPSATDDQGRESYQTDGEVCITDPSGREINVQGVIIKRIRPLTGNLCHSFSWMKMTRERYGNPFDHAIAFVAVDLDGSIRDIYCVVPLPMIY